MVIKNTDEEKIFNAALQLIALESQLLSNLFTTFLIAHSILVGAIIASIMDNNFSLNFCFNIKVFIIGFVGLLLSIMWLLAYLRGSSFYSLRVTQAQSFEPKEWHLYKDDKQFVDKGSIDVDGEKCKMNRLGKLFST